MPAENVFTESSVLIPVDVNRELTLVLLWFLIQVPENCLKKKKQKTEVRGSDKEKQTVWGLGVYISELFKEGGGFN